MFIISAEYDLNDEEILCEITLIDKRLLNIKPDLGTFSIKNRHGNYSVTIRINTPLEFDSIPTKMLSSKDITLKMLMNSDDSFIIDAEKQEFVLPEVQTYWIHYLINIGVLFLLIKKKIYFIRTRY